MMALIDSGDGPLRALSKTPLLLPLLLLCIGRSFSSIPSFETGRATAGRRCSWRNRETGIMRQRYDRYVR